MIGEWALAVGTFDCGEKLGDVGHVIHRETTLDVDVRHCVRLAIT